MSICDDNSSINRPESGCETLFWATSKSKPFALQTRFIFTYQELLVTCIISSFSFDPQIEAKDRAVTFLTYVERLFNNPKYSARWNSEQKQTIQKIMEKAASFYLAVEPGLHTNYNESFNAMKDYFAPKDTNCRCSWIHRICVKLLK